MNKIIFVIISIFFSFPAYADMSDENKSKAWDCSGIYLSNYFLPIGETFEYSMKEKSMSSVKVLKEYLGYQIGAIIGGALAPTIAVLLWDSFGIFYVSVYIAIAAVLTLLSLSQLEETKGNRL